MLDFPTIGEPHYGQAVEASLIRDKSVKFFNIEENKNPYVTKGEGESKVVRKGKRVDVYMTPIRSHLSLIILKELKWVMKCTSMLPTWSRIGMCRMVLP